MNRDRQPRYQQRTPKPFHPDRLKRPLVRCRCGKVFSPSLAAAKDAQRSVEQKKGKQNPVRFYECRHGAWHWTQKLYEARPCQSCNGMFRPSNDQGDVVICDTCEDIITADRRSRHLTVPPTKEI